VTWTVPSTYLRSGARGLTASGDRFFSEVRQHVASVGAARYR
jgi:hypothetical protein